MSLHRLALGVTGALLALGIGATAANAASAYAASTVNVRSGAGTGYAVVDVLRRGDRVEVEYCRGTWCFVEKSGPDGWVSASYLAADRGYDDDEGYYDDDYDYDDGYYDDDYFVIERPRRHFRSHYPRFHSQVCWGKPNVSFCFTD
jgi:uncharacterized protein YraI